MSLAPRLDIRQSQNLSLTPQLVQAIKLLAMNQLEVQDYVANEVAQNPFLEMQAGQGQSQLTQVKVSEHYAEEKPKALVRDLETMGFQPNGMSGEFSNENVSHRQEEWQASAQAEPDNLGFSQASLYWVETPYMDFGGSKREDNNWTEAETLYDHLLQQILLEFQEGVQRLIAISILEFVNEAGYFTGNLEEIAQRLGIELAEIEKTLQFMQKFEPAGVCASDLKSCLRLQLEDKNRHDPLMAGLLEHLDLVGKKDLATLKRVLNVDDEDLHDMLVELRGLTPKPGLNFGGGIAQTLIPDVFVTPTPDGSFKVELNPDGLPKLLVNQRYYEVVNKAVIKKEDQKYLQQNFATAQWLHKALDQRARTIIKVSAEIVRHQDAFFKHGVLHLRPLNLKTIADAIEMHESTVSRVTSNKYIACARGTFEMKYFFNSSIQNEDGSEGMAAEAVKQKIRTLIEAEDKKNTLSDEALTQALKTQGLDIARRTVMKYREAMNIGSSVERRRTYKFGS